MNKNNESNMREGNGNFLTNTSSRTNSCSKFFKTMCFFSLGMFFSFVGVACLFSLFYIEEVFHKEKVNLYDSSRKDFLLGTAFGATGAIFFIPPLCLAALIIYQKLVSRKVQELVSANERHGQI